MGGRIATLQAQTLTLLIDISISATWKSIKTLGLKNHAPRFYAPCLLLKLDLVYPFANNNIIITWHNITSLDMPSMASPLQLPLCKCFIIQQCINLYLWHFLPWWLVLLCIIIMSKWCCFFFVTMWILCIVAIKFYFCIVGNNSHWASFNSSISLIISVWFVSFW
jgi:hypothetical protein